MAKKPLPEPLRILAKAWTSIVRGPRRTLLIAAWLFVFTIAMIVARMGTSEARLGAAGMLVVALAVIGVVLWIDRRVLGDTARTLDRVATDPEIAGRAIRALSLLESGEGTSRELAELHVQRTLAAIPETEVRKGARRIASKLTMAAVVVFALNIAACVSSPWAPVEGFDIFIAKDGIAPIGMSYLGEVGVRARPPDYLHQEERSVVAYEEASLPRGTLLTFRGTPIHGGRRLLLTDGKAEVPFVDDGAGRVIARWPLAETVHLRVVARFGEIVIPEPQETVIDSIADEVPMVVLEGAPKQIVLASEEDASEIPIKYEATDDHGLREVHLVMRAGAREDRRVLAKLDGETRIDRGGYNLRATDAFIKKSHTPVEIRVEAKDNDPITGPKWGASEAITIIPPDVGEPEARRISALRKLRDQLVDSLAWRIGTTIPADLKERRAFLDKEAKLDEDDGELLETTLMTSHAGIRVSARLAVMVRARYRKVKESVASEVRSPSTTAHANVVKATERVVLVIDAITQGLGVRDSKEVAKDLADVADELGSAAQVSQKQAEKARGIQRMDAAQRVLEGGGRSLVRLGALGRDLGEIVGADLYRVTSARKTDDLPHTVLAAQDLAARLRQPDPSFGAQGGRPSHAGGESGGGRGSSGGDTGGDTGDVDEAYNEAARDLEKLAGDHAGNMGKTEQALANGSTEEDRKKLAEEAKKHAEKVREAVRPLPNVGGGSDSWTSKGAAAREHAEQMAHALEEGNASDAVQSGRSALSVLDEAKRAAQRERWRGDAPDKTIDEARKTLEQEVKWAEEKLDELRKKAAQRASSELKENGEGEGKLADRVRDVAKRGRDQDELPQQALDAMREAEQASREASRALKEGDAEKGLQKQREAQKALEQARDALGEEGRPGEEDGEGNQKPKNGHADIPKADAHKGPEEFRRRVMKGLGQPSSGRMKDAVKRYAEGLLR